MLRRVIEYLSCVKVYQCTVISALIDPSLQTFGEKNQTSFFPFIYQQAAASHVSLSSYQNLLFAADKTVCWVWNQSLN